MRFKNHHIALKIFRSIPAFQSTTKTIVTIGTFDGVHLGHQKIIQKLVEQAKETNCESLILTFFPHPRMVLQKDSEIKLLNTMIEKSDLLENLGLDSLIIHPFDKAFSDLSAEDFVVDVLIKKLNIAKIIIGHDHRFGHNRSANIEDLIAFGKKYHFEVEQILAEQIAEVSISSTKIRNALNNGNIQLANQYLGYNYLVSGQVVRGRQLGRTIGFPTANIDVDKEYKLVPQTGVYVVETNFNGKKMFGMMNIGTNPTVGGGLQKVEVHFFDFNQDLYGKNIVVGLLKRLRNEQKFDGIAQLTQQLEIDKTESLIFIKNLF